MANKLALKSAIHPRKFLTHAMDAVLRQHYFQFTLKSHTTKISADTRLIASDFIHPKSVKRMLDKKSKPSRVPSLFCSLLVLIVLTGALIGTMRFLVETPTQAADVTQSTPGNIYSYPAVVRGLIFRLLSSQRNAPRQNMVTIDDVKKLNFSQPDHSDYGDNSTLEVFGTRNLEGLRWEYYREKAKEISNDEMYHITLANRVVSAGTELPDLTAILPNVPEAFCQNAIKAVSPGGAVDVDIPTGDTPNLVRAPAIPEEANIRTIPTMMNWPHEDLILGCFRDQRNTIYYYQVIIQF